MPQYLAPGVYVEEVNARPGAIVGVGTSTAGFVGMTRRGPLEGRPTLVTNWGKFVPRLRRLSRPGADVLGRRATAVRRGGLLRQRRPARLHHAHPRPGTGSSAASAATRDGVATRLTADTVLTGSAGFGCHPPGDAARLPARGEAHPADDQGRHRHRLGWAGGQVLQLGDRGGHPDDQRQRNGRVRGAQHRGADRRRDPRRRRRHHGVDTYGRPYRRHHPDGVQPGQLGARGRRRGTPGVGGEQRARLDRRVQHQQRHQGQAQVHRRLLRRRLGGDRQGRQAHLPPGLGHRRPGAHPRGKQPGQRERVEPGRGGGDPGVHLRVLPRRHIQRGHRTLRRAHAGERPGPVLPYPAGHLLTAHRHRPPGRD